MRIIGPVILLFVINLSCENVIAEITAEAIIDFGTNTETNINFSTQNVSETFDTVSGIEGNINSTKNVNKTATEINPITPDFPPPVQLSTFENASNIRSGPVVIVDKQTIFLPAFRLEKSSDEIYFWVESGEHSGRIIPDDRDLGGSIGEHEGENIYIKLPQNMSVYDIDRFGLWSRQRNDTIGYVEIPNGIKVRNETGFHEIAADGRKIVRIPKCCSPNEILTTSGCISNPSAPFLPNYHVLDVNGTHLNDEPLPPNEVLFEPYINNVKCNVNDKKYPLYPQDEFVFLRTGILVFFEKKSVITQDQFCVETIENEGWMTVPLVCVTVEDVGVPSVIFYAYSTGLLLSFLFFILTAAAFFFVGDEYPVHGLSIGAYSLSSALAFVCLASAQLSKAEGKACNIFGYVFQLFLVSSFTWLVILCYETHFLIKYHRDYKTFNNYRLNFYFAIGLGFPALILLISILSAHVPFLPKNMFKPQFGYSGCWFEGHTTRLYFFYIPIFVGLFLCILHLVYTKYLILRFDKTEQPVWIVVSDNLKEMFRACILVVSITIVCWIVETVTSALAKDNVMTFEKIDILESIQGLIIFMVFVLHDPVKRRVYNVVCKRKRKVQKRTSSGEQELFLERIKRASTSQL